MALPLPTRSRQPAQRDPFRELDDLYDRFTSLWEAGPGTGLAGWVPSAELEETDDSWVVELELPGVAREDVDVELDDQLLTVSGHTEEKQRTGILRRSTRRTGRFEYAVTLPGDADADHVDAQLRDGVLTVRVPKSPDTRRRRIQVTT